MRPLWWTGQLQKFGEDLFHTLEGLEDETTLRINFNSGSAGLLILVRDVIVDEADLPIK